MVTNILEIEDQRKNELIEAEGVYFSDRHELTEVEELVGPITAATIAGVIKKIHSISISLILKKKLKELIKCYKEYCRTEPPDTVESIQLWLWEHIIDTYRTMRIPLSGFSDRDKNNALIFLTVLMIGVFRGIDFNETIKDITRGVPREYEKVITDRATPYLAELMAELEKARGQRGIL